MRIRVVLTILLVLAGLATLGASLALRPSPRRTSVLEVSAYPPNAKRLVAEGRVVACSGARIDISSELTGLILTMPVEENTVIEKGALIAELRSDELRASLDEARSRLAELDAEERFAASQAARRQQLSATGAISPQDRESSERDLAVVRARRAAGLATIQGIEAQLARTRILAPFRGTVLQRNASAHEIILAHAPLITLADLDRVRIEAEVDEFDAGRVEPGDAVRVTAEGSPGQAWTGRVEEVPSAVVGKRLEPRDPARPVDVRVLRVKIAFDRPTPLKLGQRVEVEIREPLRADCPSRHSIRK